MQGAGCSSRKVHASIRGRFSRHATYPRARAGMGVRIGSAPPATAPSSELKDRASRLPQPGAASTSLEGTYGRELVHRIVAHLLHLLGSFGFVGPAKVAEGLDVMLADPDAMLGATFAAFDANGDGAIDATDLATTLSLARPFFGVPHAELVAKFDAVLRGAGGPRGPKARHGIRRSDLDSVLMYTPALEAWTLTPMRATASWLRGRAETEAHADDAGWRRGLASPGTSIAAPAPAAAATPAERRVAARGAHGRDEPPRTRRGRARDAIDDRAQLCDGETRGGSRRCETIPTQTAGGPRTTTTTTTTTGKRTRVPIGVLTLTTTTTGRARTPRETGVKTGGWQTGRRRRLSNFSAPRRSERPRTADGRRPESPSILKPSGSFVARGSGTGTRRTKRAGRRGDVRGGGRR